jgi:hypothetical protein
VEKPAKWQAFLFWPDDSLKGDFEVHVLGVDGDFFYPGVSYIAGKGEAKANTLDPADENYLFGSLAHLDTRFLILDARFGHRGFKY